MFIPELKVGERFVVFGILVVIVWLIAIFNKRIAKPAKLNFTKDTVHDGFAIRDRGWSLVISLSSSLLVIVASLFFSEGWYADLLELLSPPQKTTP